ncbi:hypothetical protein MXD61_06780 [Frankia sp. AgPm24]|uniref:hypothetical protein n=1 Tax=Frankia sp. AgPm24 TaxID=631128 RepID=UPI00200F9D61|nr:hypothetical protein [Frankia sp. AgPm24]MCK9921595.1 hypothetical protein [Frankia sp. AgPm24]
MASVADSFTAGTGLTALVGAFTVTGGQLTSATAGSFVIGQYQAVALGAAQFAEMSIVTLDATTSRRWGVATRLGTAGANYMAYLDAAAGGAWELAKYTSFTYASISGAQALTIALPMRLRLESVGSTHRVLINGRLVGTYTDASVATGQYVGVYGNEPNSLVASDDFYGGDVVPPPGPLMSRAAAMRAATV